MDHESDCTPNSSTRTSDGLTDTHDEYHSRNDHLSYSNWNFRKRWTHLPHKLFTEYNRNYFLSYITIYSI
jgi:hypothetical protein